MNRALRTLGLPLLLLGALVAIGSQAWTAARVGAGMSALVACGLVHHTGLDPEWVMAHYVGPLLGAGAKLVELQHDPGTGTTGSRAAAWARGRAIVRGGVGCTLVLDEDEAALRSFEDPPHAPPLRPDLPWPEGSAPLDGPANPALVAALDEAFAEPENQPGRMRQTLAVLVAHGGRLLAERYAPGVDRDSRLLSWSAAKSVIAALLGVAEFEGRLDRFGPAPVPEWRGPADPRGSITVDQLLRMSSGLAFDETYGAVNDVSQMLFTHPDAGAFAAGMDLLHEPDSEWAYSSGTSNILARILRDLFGRDVEAQVSWSRTSFFDPIGMRSAVFETDASGSFIGSSLLLRDWQGLGTLRPTPFARGDMERPAHPSQRLDPVREYTHAESTRGPIRRGVVAERRRSSRPDPAHVAVGTAGGLCGPRHERTIRGHRPFGRSGDRAPGAYPIRPG
ncbi:MAG: serine hydrolase [bacterium]|nr:serine hydrolase [bacterium]